MTVRELINRLKTFDRDMEVKVFDYMNNGTIASVENDADGIVTIHGSEELGT